MACHKGTTRGINPALGTANTRPEGLPTQEK